MDDDTTSRAFNAQQAVPKGLIRRVIRLGARAERTYLEADWIDAIILVALGRVELVGTTNTCMQFDPGALLCLDGLPLRAVRNLGTTPVVLVSVSRNSQITTA
jgi:hypothetical protein